jgi:hypothetical protein
MLASRFEATPVPRKGCGIPQHELRWLVRQERRIGIPRPPPQVIDLTEDDDEYNLQPNSRNHSPTLTSQFAFFDIRPKEPPNRRPTSPESSANSQQASATETSHNTHNIPHPFIQTTVRPKKRKESESGEGDGTKTWGIKRRLRPKRPVSYAENVMKGDPMLLDDPEEDLMKSIEKDSSGDSDESEESDETTRVIQRSGK